MPKFFPGSGKWLIFYEIKGVAQCNLATIGATMAGNGRFKHVETASFGVGDVRAEPWFCHKGDKGGKAVD
ncbi:hypothetical protein J7443_04585 [Tropicibacter sp. R15_0]|uniref:hypothetical protein n=1 Tax=Tropicibacter sp. R15_0 TaxID=2821101 RepID=UPI001ADA5CA0|nr:hypothetical protein [Tropicibacter sp. R15_0]MBO9464497.1 hypothetical protein [Tropicibacter sp. R15_0]